MVITTDYFATTGVQGSRITLQNTSLFVFCTLQVLSDPKLVEILQSPNIMELIRSLKEDPEKAQRYVSCRNENGLASSSPIQKEANGLVYITTSPLFLEYHHSVYTMEWL